MSIAIVDVLPKAANKFLRMNPDITSMIGASSTPYSHAVLLGYLNHEQSSPRYRIQQQEETDGRRPALCIYLGCETDGMFMALPDRLADQDYYQAVDYLIRPSLETLKSGIVTMRWVARHVLGESPSTMYRRLEKLVV
ncbi:MAG: hypothetical protein HYS80_01185 [Candidatus Aenigmarchaeota archaeon]|nr:hypothetical protein [Candidatus Aenigmarchaeota archaeon]